VQHYFTCSFRRNQPGSTTATARRGYSLCCGSHRSIVPDWRGSGRDWCA